MISTANNRFLGIIFILFCSLSGFGQKFAPFSSTTNGTSAFMQTNTISGNLNGIDFGSNNAIKMALSSNGCLGIAIDPNLTITPSMKLRVKGDIGITGKLVSESNLVFHANNDETGMDGSIEFLNGSSGNPRMVISNDGNVAIGFHQSAAKLMVNSDAVNEGIRLTDSKDSNITMQTYLPGDNQSGYQAINFNGYYNTAHGDPHEEFYNANKTAWRMHVDQRAILNPNTKKSSDNFTIWRIGTGKKDSDAGGYVLHADEKMHIGIRNNTPKADLHVTANSIFEDNNQPSRPSLIFGSNGGMRLGAFGNGNGGNEDGRGYAWLQSKERTPLLLNPLANPEDVTNMEYVGVGFIKNDPQFEMPKGYLFAVNGGVLCTKLRIKKYSAWPDYVFESDYKLPTLSEVEKYISTNKHLPDVPSAATVSHEGFETAEMTAKLLQKIEELTLYVIELKKQNDTLTKQHLSLETKVNLLSK